MSLYFGLLLIMTLFGSVASLFLKKAAGSDGIVATIKNVNLYAGAVLYFCSALLNIVVLQRLDYSVVLPMTSITYIWTMIFSSLFLKEKIAFRQVIGVMLIAIGAVLLSGWAA